MDEEDEHNKIMCEEDLSPVSKEDFDKYMAQLKRLGLDIDKN